MLEKEGFQIEVTGMASGDELSITTDWSLSSKKSLAH
jgi:hypothetical protein